MTANEHTRQCRSDYKILLAEDDLINQKVALASLNQLGYRADLVANGEKAVRRLEQKWYDIVLMDCQMPRMDGYQAAKHIRNPGSRVMNRNVPVNWIAQGVPVVDGKTDGSRAGGRIDATRVMVGHGTQGRLIINQGGGTSQR